MNNTDELGFQFYLDDHAAAWSVMLDWWLGNRSKRALP